MSVISDFNVGEFERQLKIHSSCMMNVGSEDRSQHLDRETLFYSDTAYEAFLTAVVELEGITAGHI